MKKEGLYATKRLQEAMAMVGETEQEAIVQQVMKYCEEFGRKNMISRMGTTRGAMDLIDETIAQGKRVVSCRRGCHFCCKMNVDASEEEVRVIAEYCHTHNISIPKKYLRQQLNYRWEEIPFSPVSACVFLKAGECSIYEVRPLACRAYSVVSPPEFCDVPQHKGYLIAAVMDIDVEIISTAFMNETRKVQFERLPKLLLPYSK
jgi:uncharacterized protein